MNIHKNITKMILLAFILLLCFSTTAFGSDKEIKVYVNNEKVDFEVNPVLENGRISVPLRGVFEKLGAKVDWNKSILQVVIKDRNNEIAMMLYKNKVMVNGEIKDIDTGVKMINSRTFAPLRFISETLGHDVKWDGATKIVYITTKESAPKVKNNIPAVGSEENLIAILEYNSKLFRYLGMRGVSYDAALETATAEDNGTASESKTNDSSDTNNQVEGVDEGDIIKNDGKYIYIKSKNAVKIIDSNPKEPKVVSQVYVPENMDVSEIFITENKLVVIGDNNYYYRNTIDSQVEKSLDMGFMPPKFLENRCNVLIYNIEVKEKPVLEREYLFDGRYSSGRTIDNNLYLVTSKYLNIGYDYYDRNGSDYKIPLPSYTNCKTNEKTEIGYDKIKYFPNYVDSKYVLTIGINLADKVSAVDVDVYLGSTEAIYVSQDNLYTTVTDFSYDSYAESTELYNPVYNISTMIYKFKLNNGTISPAGQGEVPGSIINQFSMDEHKGMFRIATTTGEVWQTGKNESKNNVYVLDANLNVAGKLENLAPGERIYSTRFMGDKVYMVTFKTIDPLFVIDTSEPTKPKVLGFLKIPGFSTYLHPVDETHILGFGNDTTENSWGGTTTAGMKLSLFDVTDVSKPKEICTEVIGKSGTNSELLYNHKALMYSTSKELMAFPVYRTTDNYEVDFLGAYVYNVNSSGFKLKSHITHVGDIKNFDYTEGINRIIYIGDYLYTFSENKMMVHDLNTNIKASELIMK